MEKAHKRINWENYPSIATPLNEANLNKMDIALDEVDNRVLGLDTAKLDKSTANTMVKDVSFNESTGVFTITLLNGTTKTIDTKLEKMVVNFRFDYETQKLILTLVDGSEQEVDLSSLISQHEFTDSDTISLTVDSNGKVTASVKDGSITEDKLQPNFLADVKVEVAKAESSATSAYENATTASESAQKAKQYRDEAEQFRNEAFATTPDGYADLVQNVAENTAKIDIITEKAELNIKNTASGETIHLTDSADSKVLEFGLHGKAEQKQYSGKNLLQNIPASQTKNGITFNVDDSGVVTANGVSSESVNFSDYTLKNYLDAGTYIVSGCPSGGGTTTFVVLLGIKNTDGSFVQDVIDTGSGKTFTITQEQVDSGVYVNLVIRVYAGQTVSNLKFYPMIRKASITDSTFEPYVGGMASPSPDYPQDIEVAGASGSVEVKSVGKNLIKNTATSTTTKGIDITVNSDGSLTANGTCLYSTLSVVLTTTTLKKGVTYAITDGIDGNINGVVNEFSIAVRLPEGVWLMSTDGINGRDVYTPTEDTEVEVIFRVYLDKTVNNLTFYPMLRLASDTDDTYEPYTETISTISTPDGIASIGDVHDEIIKYADGSGKRIQRIKKVVFDGTTQVLRESAVDGKGGRILLGRFADIKTPTSSSVKADIMSTHYNVVTAAQAYNHNNGISVNTSGDFYIWDDAHTEGTESYQAWLTEHPNTVYYVLATPIITDLTAEEIAEIEKLHTFYPVTNISNDADCGMAVTYLADSKNYIDNQLAIQAKAQEETLLNMLLLMPESVQASMIENDTNNLLTESGV